MIRDIYSRHIKTVSRLGKEFLEEKRPELMFGTETTCRYKGKIYQVKVARIKNDTKSVHINQIYLDGSVDVFLILLVYPDRIDMCQITRYQMSKMKTVPQHSDESRQIDLDINTIRGFISESWTD